MKSTKIIVRIILFTVLIVIHVLLLRKCLIRQIRLQITKHEILQIMESLSDMPRNICMSILNVSFQVKFQMHFMM